MKYAMGSKPYPKLDAPLLRVEDAGETLAYSDGPDQGRVVSCQPDGSLDSRNAGTAGGFELCQKGGGFAAYDPEPSQGGPYLFTLTPMRDQY